MKRLLDIFLSISLLVILSPILLIISFLIFVVDGLPIFFIQQRIGKNKTSFNLIKFRTMKNDIYLSDEKRITKLGSFLRSTSLDEIPNLINVISSKMSIVGPRPLPVIYEERFSSAQSVRHNIKPGITGWAQINGRNLNSWEKKFELDIWYVNNQNLFLDIKIIFLTIITIISQKGINDKYNKQVKEFQNEKKQKKDQ